MSPSCNVDSFARPRPVPARAKVPIWRTMVKADSKRKNGTSMHASLDVSADPQSTINHLQARIDELEHERKTFKVRVVNPEVLCREDLVRDNFRLQEEVVRLKEAQSSGEGAGSMPVNCECLPDLAQKVRDYEGLISRLKEDYLELRRIVYSLEHTNMNQAEHITKLENLSRMHEEAEKARQQVQSLTSAMATQLSEWQADDEDDANDYQAADSEACIVA
ncbi:hypothetical protein BD626DRAFT_542075 [Schizophyllum amplum]|uniref:Uncharacterized protein n=1 Tax=Schizophyllum amplum TaxID=97359 RepID=A0A550BT01_9AGAR|nr:hypothetical protein BD626DRAFT_542075 [Auriculariopsis ampla]